jgi:hypothetical protein
VSALAFEIAAAMKIANAGITHNHLRIAIEASIAEGHYCLNKFSHPITHSGQHPFFRRHNAVLDIAATQPAASSK